MLILTSEGFYKAPLKNLLLIQKHKYRKIVQLRNEFGKAKGINRGNLFSL